MAPKEGPTAREQGRNDADGPRPGWEGLHEIASGRVLTGTPASTLVQKSSEHHMEHPRDPAHTQQVPQHLPNKAQTGLLCLAFKAFHNLSPTSSPPRALGHSAAHTLYFSRTL